MKISSFLRNSARFTETLAKYTCPMSHTESSCEWYHGPWQYLRLLDLVGSPLWHQDFFMNAINSTVSRNDRILISGTADYTMLAVILQTLGSNYENVQIDVLESCLTPLILNDWYASSIGNNVNTIHQNVHEVCLEKESYDLILADEFLTRFSPADKSNVLDQWASLLSPSGRIATTIRIDPEIKNEAGLGDEEVQSFPKRAYSKALEANSFPIDPMRMKSLAKRFAEGYEENVRNPIKNKPECSELFISCGLSVSDIHINTVRREVNSTKVCQVLVSNSL